MLAFATRASRIILDFAALSAAYWLAFLLRFEFQLTLEATKLLFFTWPYIIIFQYVTLALFGVPRFAWRYIGLREAKTIFVALAVPTAILTAIRIGLAPLGGYTKFIVIPLSVIAMDCLLAFMGIAGVRVARRMVGERVQARRRDRSDPNTESIPTVLIGAGEAGVMVAKEIGGWPNLGIKAIGFLDDDRLKVGSIIHGIRVLGTTSDMARVMAEHEVRQALITIANAPGAAIRRITRLCEEADLEVKIIPGVYEIVGGRVNLSRIRKVAIEDLLGREPVALDVEAISRVVRGRVVLITGAGGSIGSELCRQVCRYEPERLVLVERAENNLFNIHRELVSVFPRVAVVPCVADVGDEERMRSILAEHRPAVLFHAAAHKHVPMMEWNPGEAVKNNVIGTRVVADLAAEYDVAEFVMISTDKAVNPTSVMGATKRIAEIYIQSLSQRTKTRFVTVRFGNVLGSAGSVVPLFQEQILKGGPVTVTHPDMRRYFMTIPEACQLVLQAASMGKGGEIFILDMGEPMRIVDLAEDLIRLSGLRPHEDIEIVFSGTRPGEKLFEEISAADEHADKTRHPKIYVGRTPAREWMGLPDMLAQLHAAARGGEQLRVRQLIAKLVPEYLGVDPASEASANSDARLSTHAATSTVAAAIPEPAPPQRLTKKLA